MKIESTNGRTTTTLPDTGLRFRLRAAMLFVALTSMFAALMAVRADAATVVMNGGHAWEKNYGSPYNLNTIVVCDTKADGYWIRGEAILEAGVVRKETDRNGSQTGCSETLYTGSEIIAIRVCRVGDACTSWRPS